MTINEAFLKSAARKKRKKDRSEGISPWAGAAIGAGLGGLAGVAPYLPLAAALDPKPVLAFATLTSLPTIITGGLLGAGGAMLYNLYRRRMEE